MSKRKSGTDTDHVLVYSTDPVKPQPSSARCGGCRREQDGCVCKGNRNVLAQRKIHARIERKGRGGKTVTILEKFPPHTSLLEELCKALKKRLGTGGTVEIEGGVGRIEIQGERCEEVLSFAQGWIAGK